MIQDDIKKLAESLGTNLEEKKGIYTLKLVVAERKAFLSKKKLEYVAKFRLAQDVKTVKFTEILIESGSGLSMGGGMDEMTPGLGFKVQSYKTSIGPREGSIEEQSVLFGKTYQYKFNFKTIREKFKSITQKAGWNFRYQITPIGL
jgi:hypothetical protein